MPRQVPRSDEVNWNDATDEQLRTAVAERVMGWELKPWDDYGHWWKSWWKDNNCVTDATGWLCNWNRDDLALVFKAAWERINGPDAPGWCCQDERVVDAWNAAMDDWWCAPRLAVVGILELVESLTSGEPK